MSKDRPSCNNRSVSNNWGVGNGGSGSIGGHALVGHVGDVATVSISHVVVDVLDPAVGQGHPVGAAGGVAVTLLVLTEVGAAVVVGHAVLVGVDGGAVGGGVGGGGGVGHSNRGVGDDRSVGKDRGVAKDGGTEAVGGEELGDCRADDQGENKQGLNNGEKRLISSFIA